MSITIDKHITWSEVTQKGINFENLLVSFFAQGFITVNRLEHKPFGPSYNRYYRQFDTHRDFAEEDVQRIIRESREVERKRPGSILQSYRDFLDILYSLVGFATRLYTIDFSRRSSVALAAFLETHYIQPVAASLWYPYNNYLYQYLGDDLYALIQRSVRDIHQQAEVFEVLTQARELSVIQKEKRDLAGLASHLSVHGGSLDHHDAQQRIDRHVREYGYMGCYYFRGSPWSRDDVTARLEEKLGSGEFNDDLKQVDEYIGKNKQWRELCRSLGFSERDVILVETLKELAYAINVFDEVWNYLGFMSQPFFAELCQRLQVTYDEFIEMNITEVVSCLYRDRGVDDTLRARIHERLQDSAFIMVEEDVVILSGSDLDQYRALHAARDTIDTNVSELRGQSASRGHARGVVATVYGIEDLGKVRKGNIMIAKNTVPSFVPAMENAAAIITETGGLLSHAAIVSRELKIPCVVGVKHLMKILKDGDEVEVNAQEGVVKKLS